MSPLTDRTRSPEAMTSAGDQGHRDPVEHVGDVVAHPGQRAKVDLAEAQLRDDGQSVGQHQVPKLMVEQPSRSLMLMG